MNAENYAILEALEKAVDSGNITAIVPEDLEVQAHNTLWDETTPGQLTLLKLVPSVKATSVVHQYSKVTSYGNRKGNSGFFGEKALPPETNFKAERVTNNIRLLGEIGPTFLLAALEQTQQALGTSGAQNIERVALRRNVLDKKNRALYFSDTRCTKDGDSSLRFKGLYQLIEEGTDGTTGKKSPFGSHIIDMEGQPLVADTIRDRIAKGLVVFGRITSLLTDPYVRSDMESSLDGANRLAMPAATSAYLIGQQVAGLQSQGGITWFETDNGLTPQYARPQYDTDLVDGAPTTKPSVTASAGAPGGSRVSKWDTNSAGNIFWVVTETVDESEGLGTRYPTGTGSLAVAAGQEVTLTITPGNPNADSFKVYRGTGTDDATEAWFVFEVAGAGGGAPVTAYDDNKFRPNTSWAFGLNVVSGAERALHSPGEALAASYASARTKSSSFLEGNDREGNTVAVAQLGPQMGVMALASVLAQVDRPLLYTACTPEVRNPYQNLVFINIGRANQ
jgi:hypothetical protein